MDVCSNNIETARVAYANRGTYILWTQTGAECRGTLSGALLDAPAIERPATGDWVRIETETGRIREVLPRKTCLMRKKVGRATEEQVIAANVDVMFIVMALDGDFNIRRLERYLVMAEESGASPVVVLNKSDLCNDLTPRLNEIDRVTHAPAIVMSAIDRGSVAQLARYIEVEQTGALVGSSGVGKSTIVNSLLGVGQQAVAPVRESDSRGRHTTTHREMFRLGQGWILIDMPGMRELAPWSGTDSVASAFGEIEELAQGCQFRDCRHRGEPGCKVIAAVAAGTLDADRLESFHKLFDEVGAQERKRMARIGCKGVRQILKTQPKHWRGD
ncbi:MAG TPA: ribosome small subunit-dependent GTPase A [Bryobacteraceae bacterium]|jgi:ribosome biogenesis GTPase